MKAPDCNMGRNNIPHRLLHNISTGHIHSFATNKQEDMMGTNQTSTKTSDPTPQTKKYFHKEES